MKQVLTLYTSYLQEISQSNISYWKKDEMRTNLKNLKKQLDDLDRANKAAVVNTVNLHYFLIYYIFFMNFYIGLCV